MTLREIEGRSGRPRRTELGRRGPWGAPLCAVWKQKQHDRGRYRRSNTPMGRWPGEFIFLLFFYTIFSAVFLRAAVTWNESMNCSNDAANKRRRKFP